MMLGLIQQFGNSSSMLGIAWPLSRMQIWGPERMYEVLGCTFTVETKGAIPLWRPSPWSVLDDNFDSFPACLPAISSK